ncbi:MAG: hemolysin family protein [bacterium]|nr:hemolysin family protein [bacterium]
MNAALGLLVLALSIVGYAVVNSIEIAVVGANRIRIRHLAEGGNRAAQALERLHSNQDRFFAALVLLQNILVVLAATMGSLVAIDIAGGIGVAVATILVAITTALFGELAPKVLAVQASERYALAVALPAEALMRVLGPLVVVLTLFTGLISRALLGRRLEAGPAVTEAELRMLIGMSAEAGSVAEEEAELLARVFHFGDRRVHEVMIPRTEAVWLERGTKVRDFYRVFDGSPHSRFPVYEGSPDNVVGIVGIKEVLRAIARGEMNADSSLDGLVRPAHFVPETKPIGDLFREMQARGAQMAIAVDEYGGTAGIVTLELLLEEMVGPVRDELRAAEEEIQEIDERTVQVDGSLSVTEAREELGIDIPEGPYDTFAGFVLSQLGHIPREGEYLPFAGHRIAVAAMKGPKIELLRVTRA